MNRWVIRAIVCLLLGAVMTIAVAWGICIWHPESVSREDWTQTTVWPTALPDDWLSLKIALFVRFTDSYTLTEFVATGFPLGRPEHVQAWMIRAGWPFRALRSERYRVESPGARYGALNWSRPATWSEGIALPELPDWVVASRHRQVLPNQVDSIGFVLNTLFYAAVSAWMWFAFGSARPGIRRRRGRCPMCGYDLRGTLEKGCSECGWNREMSSRRDGGM
jgi:hypothetical protein